MSAPPPNRWNHVARQVSSHLRWGEKAIQTLAHMRQAGGSPISMALSGMSLVSHLIDTFVPNPEVSAYMTSLGYKVTPWHGVLDAMVKDWLSRSEAGRAEQTLWDGQKLIEYPEYGLAWISTGKEAESHTLNAPQGAVVCLYYRADAEASARIDQLVDREFWIGGDQEVSTQESEVTTVLHFRPLPEPIPEYLGDPSPEAVAEDLRQEQVNVAFFYGPSGSGKSSLARRVARQMNPRGRMLRFSTREFGAWNLSTLRQMVSLLRPSVLLVDDVQMYLEGSGVDELIETLEGVVQVTSETGALLFGTVMTDDEFPPAREGMRPGRIDRWIHVPRPDAGWRSQILELYLGRTPPPAMVEATEGLTGAYLRRVATAARGKPHLWRKIVAEVRVSVPEARDAVASAMLRRLWLPPPNKLLTPASVRLRGTLSEEERIQRDLEEDESVAALVRRTLLQMVHKGRLDIRDLEGEAAGILDALNATAPHDADGTSPQRFQDRHIHVVTTIVLDGVLGPGWKDDPDALAFLC